MNTRKHFLSIAIILILVGFGLVTIPKNTLAYSASFSASANGGADNTSVSFGGGDNQAPTLTTTGTSVKFVVEGTDPTASEWNAGGGATYLKEGSWSGSGSFCHSACLYQSTVSGLVPGNYTFYIYLQISDSRTVLYGHIPVTILSTAPATINVNNTCAVSGGSWSISPGQLSGTSNTVSPSAGGTTYSIAYTPPTGYSGTASPSSQIVFPGDTDTFTLSCPEIPHLLTIDIKASTNPYQCSAGTTVTWSTTNVTSCSAGWTGSTATSGSQAVNPSTSPQTYSMTCTNGSESVTNSVVVTASNAVNGSCPVTPPPAGTPAISISANPTKITPGQSTTLTWSGTDVTSCSAWWTGSTAASGSQQVGNIVNTTDYPIQCTGPDGTVNGSAHVTVTKTQAVIFIYSNIAQGGGTANPGGLYGQGTGLGSYGYVTPNPAKGTVYTLTPNNVPGYTFNHVEDGQTGAVGSSALLFPGDSKFFDVVYDQNAPSFDYSLSASGNTTVAKGGSNQFGQNTITETLTTGTGQNVALSLAGLPSGVTYSVSPTNGCSPTCQSVVTFTVTPSAVAGTYPITVTGSPLGHTTNFNLIIQNSSAIVVTCTPSPASPLVGQAVTWTANASGGNGGPYTYSWSGTNVPSGPAPSQNPYTITYSTVGQKTAQVTATDSASNSGSCNAPGGTVQVNFNPQFKEF